MIDLSTTTPPPQAAAAAPKSEPLTDPLLVCLAMVAKLLGQPVHQQVLRAGFALDQRGRVPLAAYPDMAHQHGLMAAWSRTKVAAIPAYVLPVLMPLKDGRACILRQLKDGVAHVLWADTGMQEHQLPIGELQALAREEVLVVKLPPKRHEQTLAPMHGAAFEWFWGTLWRFRHFYVESMVATVMANLLTLASVFFTMNVYDRVVPTQAYASLWTLAIGTTLAAIGGLFLGQLQIASTELESIGLLALPAVVIGGLQSIPGAIIGGLLVGVIEQMASAYISPKSSDIVIYLLLLVILMLRPWGLFGQRELGRV